MAFNDLIRLGASAAGAYEIEKSLRFNAGDTAHLTYTPGGAGDSRQMTFSFWVKRSSIGTTATTTNYLWTAWNGSNTDRIGFTSDDQLIIELKDGGSTEAEWHTDYLFRDPSAWYHIVVAFDTEQGTTDNRMKLYVNGTLITDFDTKNTVGEDYDLEGFNTVNMHTIGRYQADATTGGNSYLSGYMAEIHFIDGTQKAASDFGETDTVTGQWIPKKYAGAYGTRGFYLPLTGESLNTSFVDSSSYARPVTRVGDAINSTVQKKVGASSIRRPSTPNSCIHVPDSSDFDWGTNDWTLECWIRRDAQGGDEWLMAHSDGTGANTSIGLHIWSSATGGTANKPSIRFRQSSSNIDCNGTTALAAATWYHIAGVRDGNTLRIYVNGVQEGTTSISGSPDTSSASFAFTALRSNGDAGLTGYMDEIRVSKSCRYTSGTSFTPSTTAFGSDANTLVLIHSNLTGTDIAADTSGNGNNWTANNISITAGAGNDSLTDTPTNNFCTGNPLSGRNTNFVTPTNGNLDFSIGGTEYFFMSTMLFPKSGKWYVECLYTTVATGRVGVSDYKAQSWGPDDGTGHWAGISYLQGGTIRVDDSNVQTGLTSVSDNDIVGIAVDRDAGTVQFSINGTNKGSAVNISSLDSTEDLSFHVGRNGSSGGNPVGSVNFGQRPFANQPAGFLPLCTANLPTSTIIEGGSYFKAKLYTGNGSTQAITGLGFSPNLVTCKRRDGSGDNQGIFDTVRGATKELNTNASGAEGTCATCVTSFDADGFTLGNNGGMNGSGETYVAWNWKESASAGFDIVGYTGTGSATTVPHSLGAVPDVVIVKNRDVADGWQIQHVAKGPTFTQQMDGSGAFEDNDTVWNDTAPTSSTFAVGTDDKTNASGEKYIAYVWSGVDGYSKFGSYVGNGNTNGNFIYTGFKPAMIWIKNIGSSENWEIWDTARDPINVVKLRMATNTDGGDVSSTFFDLVSNGVKFRNTSGGYNSSGHTFVYLCFAERAFKYANAS